MWLFFWAHHKFGLVLAVISMHFRVLSYKMGIFLGVVTITTIFGVLDILDIFFFFSFFFFFFGGGGGGLNSRCWVQAYV